MTNNKLAILAFLAVVTAGWAVLQSRISQPTNASTFSSSPLVEGLDLDSVASIMITSEAGSKTVTLDRLDGKFVVKDKNNYPADVSKINGLITKCLDIRTRDKITSNAENHADLKVTPETARCTVSFMDKDQKPIVGLAISESDPEKGNAHARLLSENDVYMIDSDPWISTGAMDYINTKLLEVPQDKMAQVGVHTPQDSYSLKLSESGAIELEAVPADKKQKDSVCKSVFGALSYLQFEDVMKDAPEGTAFDHTYSGKLSDTTVYKLSMAKKDDKVYAKVSADFMDKAPVEKEQRVESEEELKKKEAKLLAIDAVNLFNQQHSGWVYQLPSYKAGDLTKSLADLVENPAPADPNAPAAESAPVVSAEPAA